MSEPVSVDGHMTNSLSCRWVRPAAVLALPGAQACGWGFACSLSSCCQSAAGCAGFPVAGLFWPLLLLLALLRASVLPLLLLRPLAPAPLLLLLPLLQPLAVPSMCRCHRAPAPV
jgi:hypothetical protein